MRGGGVLLATEPASLLLRLGRLVLDVGERALSLEVVHHLGEAAGVAHLDPQTLLGALGDDLAGLGTGWLLIKDRVRVLEIQA